MRDKMTDKEIVQALRACGKGAGCDGCYAQGTGDCGFVKTYAADAIERLTAEIENWKRDYKVAVEIAADRNNSLKTLTAVVERLTARVAEFEAAHRVERCEGE